MTFKDSAHWLQKARDKWSHRGTKRPEFAVEPKNGQRSVWDFPRPPKIERVHKQLLVRHEGHKIVDSCNALAVLETASPPTYYIPQGDIDMSLLTRISGKSSMCEWKGKAVYWRLKIHTAEFVAWSYPNPFAEFEALRDYLAFYPQKLECSIAGIQVKAQSSEFYAGWITPDLVGPFKGDPGTCHW